MGFRDCLSSFQREGGNGLGCAVGLTLRYRYQQVAFSLERTLLSDRGLYEHRVRVNQSGVAAAADPRELRYVDPRKIRKLTGFDPRFCWRKIGAVKGGDWDIGRSNMLDKPFFRDIYAALQARYVAGKPWDEIALVQDVRDGNRHWHHHTGEAVWDRCDHLDRLYESIRTEGYLAQREVLDMTFSEACESDSVSILEWLDDIGIDIGRDGQFFRHEGKHRLWFAQILGLKRIPVCVVVRHARWQALRDEIASTDHVDELSERARPHLDHPDLVDVRSSLSGIAQDDVGGAPRPATDLVVSR